jgi:hypothetical protein
LGRGGVSPPGSARDKKTLPFCECLVSNIGITSFHKEENCCTGYARFRRVSIRQKGETAMGYAILKGEVSIQAKIRELFTSHTRSRRRVIFGPLAALVPPDHFPDIRDVEFYSWGQENLLDPSPLSILAEKGVRINWVNPTHLRFYWVKGKGAVIGPGLGASNLLAEFDRQERSELALYLDAGALLAVDEVLGPLVLDPDGSNTFSNLQESYNLLWRLAEGITAIEPPRPRRAKVPVSAAEPNQTRDSLAALKNRQRAWALESWQIFLAEEIHEPEGLLCFYDRPRAAKVEHCRSFFGRVFS